MLNCAQALPKLRRGRRSQDKVQREGALAPLGRPLRGHIELKKKVGLKKPFEFCVEIYYIEKDV